jgi:polyhydroxyalkanoate synthesis regulator phasin
MSEQPDTLVLELLRTIRADQEQTNAKLGSLTQSMVSMRKDINALDTRIAKLDDSVQSLRADVRMIAIAVEEHTS